jgi:hypothetical protein
MSQMKTVKRHTSDNTATGFPLVLEPVVKQRRITRSVTRRVQSDQRAETFERVVGPVLASGYLRWHEAENLGKVNRGCRVAWKDQKELYADWRGLLKELNSMNCTNRCCNCEQTIILKANRSCCSIEKWNKESFKRIPDFQGIVDLVMASGVLNWREKGGIRRISKTCYKIHKEQCTCPPQVRTAHILPFLKHDPRYEDDYEELSDHEKCLALTKYTSWMIQNIHSFYNFRKVTDPACLPYGLGGMPWFDIQMVTLQRGCPRRYAFVMNMVSLYIAQGELQRSPPNWYASAFLGQRHDPGTGSSYEECLGSGISEFCLPATDEVLCRFLWTKCYPSTESQAILGPLVRHVSIFAPFFSMVPLDAKKLTRLPNTLEVLDAEMIDSMSLHFFCTIS